MPIGNVNGKKKAFWQKKLVFVLGNYDLVSAKWNKFFSLVFLKILPQNCFYLLSYFWKPRQTFCYNFRYYFGKICLYAIFDLFLAILLKKSLKQHQQNAHEKVSFDFQILCAFFCQKREFLFFSEANTREKGKMLMFFLNKD